jgi:hypothetical protein
METAAREQMGVIVRHCAPKSVEEAKEAAKKHPELTLKIYTTAADGTCIAIKPRDFKSDADEIVPIFAKGHEAVRRIFRRREK